VLNNCLLLGKCNDTLYITMHQPSAQDINTGVHTSEAMIHLHYCGALTIDVFLSKKKERDKLN